VAKDAELELSAVLSSDERVVVDTREHVFRGLGSKLVGPVIVLILLALFLGLVWWGRNNLPDWPVISVVWNALYDWIFVERWGAIGTVTGYFIIVFSIAKTSFDFRGIVNVATNKRIIRFNKKSGKVLWSVPWADVKKVVLWGRRGKGSISFGMEHSEPRVAWWYMIIEAESVWKKLQSIIPKADAEFVRKRHSIGWTLLWLGGTVCFLGLVPLMSVVVRSLDVTLAQSQWEEEIVRWLSVTMAGALVLVLGYHLVSRFAVPKGHAHRK